MHTLLYIHICMYIYIYMIIIGITMQIAFLLAQFFPVRMSMESKNNPFYFFLLFIFLTILLSSSPFCSLASSDHQQQQQQQERDFREWISWNMETYYRNQLITASIKTELFRSSRGGGGESRLDEKLSIAENNSITLSVNQEGTSDFRTIGEALNSIPLPNTRKVIIFINPGVYREKIHVPRTLPFITFTGNVTGNPPTITGNDTASVYGKDGKPLRTLQSATVAIDADYFVANNINFENTAAHVVGSIGGQAVALRISGTKAAFYNCSFYGSQDTLYDHRGFHYFYNCFIQGSVDFIFGYGRSLYQNCTLHSVAKKGASLTAQKRTNSSLSSGFSFKDCKITGSGWVYLGRAWGEYSRVIFSYTYMENIIFPQGWSDWDKKANDGKVYYGEYKCSGPGANRTGRVPWARLLTDEEAFPFIGTYYVYGDTWITNPLLPN